MTKEKIQSFTLRITNANKTGMMEILYDMGIEYLKDALTALENEQYGSFAEELHRAKNVIKELMNSVNTDDETGRVFLSLYIFAGQEITHGMIYKDRVPIENVIRMFSKMSETYNKLASLDTSEAVMEHAETIYSGLTYNKNRMAENIQNRDMSRGFLA